MTSGLAFAEVTEKIVGAYYEVYNQLGSGFLESVYHSALLIVLRRLGLRVVTRSVLPVWFQSQIIGEFNPDLIVNECVIVEIKVARQLGSSPDHKVLLHRKSHTSRGSFFLPGYSSVRYESGAIQASRGQLWR